MIGRLDEDRVLAIEHQPSGARERSRLSVKAVMDALDMPMVSGSVPNVTAFYTLMYFRPADLDRLFAEVRLSGARRGALHDSGTSRNSNAPRARPSLSTH